MRKTQRERERERVRVSEKKRDAGTQKESKCARKRLKERECLNIHKDR